MNGIQAYTLRKTGRTHIWGSYRTQHVGRGAGGGARVRSLVANDETELKNLTFWTYQKILKLGDSQLEP
jgi:hypothetical protein